MENLQHFIDLLKIGEIVALPTETVYGLAAEATNKKAVQKVYSYKRRPSENPLILHVRDIDMAKQYGVFCPIAIKLSERFWPGPLTIVVPALTIADEKKRLSPLIQAGLDTIAIRVPSHPLMLRAIHLLQSPIAAPSANISGTLSPTHPDHIKTSFGENTPPILDAGLCSVGIESTIVTIKDNKCYILREGALCKEIIMDGLADIPVLSSREDKITAPGKLSKHYAPQKPIKFDLKNITSQDGLLCFGTKNIPDNIPFTYQLSKTENLVEAAARLFEGLHYLDSCEINNIFIAPIPDEYIGCAIQDRLRRASA